VEQLNDKWFRIAGIPLSVVMLLLAEMPFFFPGRWDLLWKYTVVSIVFTGLIWENARHFLIYVRRRLPGLENTQRRVLTIFAGFLVIIAIGQALLLLFIEWLAIAPGHVLTWKAWFINFLLSLFSVIVIASIYEAIYFFGYYKITLQRTEHLKKEQAQKHLEALKNRVNPHFLFNSLTTLSALIGEDGPRAERFVDELSKVYRYLLRANRQRYLPLADELVFLQSYTFLLETRLGPAFEVRSSVEPRFFECKLPPLTLQNLLDYLVRTQTIAPEKPLTAEISANENGLTLICPHQPKTVWIDSGNMDWAEISATYEQQTGRQAVQAVVNNRLHFRLPFMQENPVAV